jgi:tetratricopeptide (TPR) repeat protein
VTDSTAIRQQQRASAVQAGLRLGERLRQLRVAASMTQTDLAGDRFSKEYVSQIERGKTRPTRETIDWLAQRLGVDAGFLANGVSADERGRVDAALARAEALLEARRNDEALEEFESVRSAVLATGMPELEARALSGEATARMRAGEVREAIALLERARALSERTSFSDVERADVLFRLGVARYKLNSIQTAIGLFDEALKVAERAKAVYEELSDRGNLGRLLNNLGGINFLLGHPEEAVDFLKDAVGIALEVGNDAEAAHAVNGIAQVHLRTGDVERAEQQARYALELLGNRVDETAEIGNAQLVLGRALLEQGRLDEADEALKAGERAYDQLSSGSHRATAWVAQGDLAARRGDDRAAARLYRQAADALQDVRF